ncbi:sugar transferase [Brevundimonas sp. SGAir0440]|uniref:sugar transferase n=1 Tax=Brevundimonas sp. SGAir0440 TaxID=2579977 RepID=UPI001AF004FF|nr:sugar transferase [Brevundimonas sp. SGAir0440]
MSISELAGCDVTSTRDAIASRRRVRLDPTRAMDVVFALIGLLLTWPLFVFIALGVRAQDGGSAIFRQQRIGRDGRLFDCLKFRSMTLGAEQALPSASDPEWQAKRKLTHDPRVTSLGRVLRRSSFDELPQLINVLRGEMSLVGPRPIVIDEAARYGRRLADYCAVRPGLTGLWQVSGRNAVPYPRRVAMDVWLVRNRTIGVYLAILARTIPAVLSRRGVS